MHPNCQGKIGKWITSILEYDLEIKPTKLIKGKGLAQLLVESNCKAMNLNLILNNSIFTDGHVEKGNVQVYPYYFQLEWCKDIIHFLQTLEFPVDTDKSKTRSFKLKAINYCIMNEHLYWKDPTSIF